MKLQKPRQIFNNGDHAQLRRQIIGLPRDVAVANLISACEKLVKNAHWHAYGSKVSEIRIPLAQIKFSKP